MPRTIDEQSLSQTCAHSGVQARKQHQNLRSMGASLAISAALFLALAGSTLNVASAAGYHSTSQASSTTPSASTSTIGNIVFPYSQTPTMKEYALSMYISLGMVNLVTVACPQGAYALGGGWSVPGPSARVYGASVSGNSWVISVQSLRGYGVQVPVTAYVECLSGVTSATVTQNNITTSAAGGNKLAVQAVLCSTGFPVGYGFDLSASPTNLELMATNPETFESAVWWNFWVRNHDSVARQVSYSVVCLSNVTAVIAGTLRSLNISPSFPGQQGGYVYASMTGTVTVSCPSGALVAGGGLNYGDSPNLANVGIGNIAVLHAVSGGWQGSLYGVTGVGLYPLVPSSWAVCVTFY